jgi:hypothetical protein
MSDIKNTPYLLLCITVLNAFACDPFGTKLPSLADTSSNIDIQCPGDVSSNSTAAGGEVFVLGEMEISATFYGGSANYVSDLSLYSPTSVPIGTTGVTPYGHSVVLGTFTKGEKLVFKLYVHETADTWYSGSDIENSDGHIHARILQAEPGLWYGGFEDLTNIGDSDFNDICFSISGELSLENPMDTSQ